MLLKPWPVMFVFLLAALTPSVSAASDPEARALMTESRELRRGLENSVSDVTMEIIDEAGRSTVRKMRQYVLEVAGAGNQTINVFSWPADVNGVSILTHSGLTGEDTQWLYLPSFERVRRISSSNRSGAFVGSEFAYEDLSSFEVGKYEFKGVTREDGEGGAVLVVESRPVYDNSGYTRLRTLLSPDTLQPNRIEYFNRRGEHFKTLTLSDYRPYAGERGWRPHTLTMRNHQSKRSTVISFEPYRPSTDSPSLFNPNRFQQAR